MNYNYLLTNNRRQPQQPETLPTYVGGGSRKGGKAWAIGIAVCVCIVVIIIAVAGAMNSHNHVDNNSPTPAPNSLFPWDPPTPRPTPTGCTDTPGWVDRDDRGCDFYKNFPSLCSSSSFEGSMGPATKHCCTCGGGYVPPTPMPSSAPTTPTPLPSRTPTTPRPTQPSACIDTAGFVDRHGWECNTYQQYSSFCESADIVKGDMGSATEHCCVCGGGNVPSKSSTSKAPAISNTPTVAPTPPTPVAVQR